MNPFQKDINPLHKASSVANFSLNGTLRGSQTLLVPKLPWETLEAHEGLVRAVMKKLSASSQIDACHFFFKESIKINQKITI